MSRTALRTVAAVLSAAITISVLKWIAVLATVDTRALPVVVMPPVVVTATALDAAPRLADAASPTTVIAGTASDGGPN